MKTSLGTPASSRAGLRRKPAREDAGIPRLFGGETDMAMYCPRCANPAVEGQRYCRTCGMSLGVILDAMEGKRPGPIDFETLKSDLKDLGSSLRAGFEQASATF